MVSSPSRDSSAELRGEVSGCGTGRGRTPIVWSRFPNPPSPPGFAFPRSHFVPKPFARRRGLPPTTAPRILRFRFESSWLTLAARPRTRRTSLVLLAIGCLRALRRTVATIGYPIAPERSTLVAHRAAFRSAGVLSCCRARSRFVLVVFCRAPVCTSRPRTMAVERHVVADARRSAAHTSYKRRDRRGNQHRRVRDFV